MVAPMARFLALRPRGAPSTLRLVRPPRRRTRPPSGEKITYLGLGIATCTVLAAAYNLSKGHCHFPEPPPYPYLHIRNKEFPWGPDGLFERKQHSDHH